MNNRYDIEDEEYKRMKWFLSDVVKEAGNKVLLWEFSAFIRFLDKKKVDKNERMTEEAIDKMFERFKSHYKDYDESSDRDFCDALISAKNDALRDGKESAPYLTDKNLAMTVFDLYFGNQIYLYILIN